VQIVTFGFLVYEVVARLQEYVAYLRLTIKLADLAAAVNQLDVSNQAGKVELGFGFYFWYLLMAHLAVAVIAAVGLALVIVPPFGCGGCASWAPRCCSTSCSTSSARSATRSSRP
jgi:hypothetical protein